MTVLQNVYVDGVQRNNMVNVNLLCLAVAATTGNGLDHG